MSLQYNVHDVCSRKIILVCDYRGRHCCSYGVLHSPGERGSSTVTPCGMMVVGGGGEGEVKVWNCDNGKNDFPILPSHNNPLHLQLLKCSVGAFTCIFVMLLRKWRV